MATNKHIARTSQRIRPISTDPRPMRRALLNHSELVQLERELQAKSYREVAKCIKDIEALTDLTPYEQHKLSLCNALSSSAITSRRAYEADIADSLKHRHMAPYGPAKPFTTRERYEVLKHNHSDSSYMDCYSAQGIYSHKVPHSGPARVDQLADNIRPSRLPSTDALARPLIGHKAANMSASKAIDSTLRRAHMKRKRGHRNRGKGVNVP